MERIKLIWDFRGPDSGRIAEHHATHLHEFSELESLQNYLIGSEKISEMHHIAFLVVEKEVMNRLRDLLKPNRGQLFKSA